MHKLVVLRKLVDIGAYLQVNEDGTLAGIDAAFQYTHLIQGSHIQSLLLGQIVLDAFLVGCLFWQNSNLIFLYHKLNYFEL